MKKYLLLVTILGITAVSQAQNSTKDETKITDTITGRWKNKGNLSFLFNQSNFNNWIAGGENNMSGNLGINYDFNYKKSDISWDNKVIASYGLLLMMIADEVGMVPDQLIGNLGDVHLYSNHIEQAKQQIQREPMKLPTVHVRDGIYCSSQYDVVLLDYESHPTIKAPLSN